MSRKRRRTLHPLGITLAILLVSVVGYVVLAAALQTQTTTFAFADLIASRALDCLVVAWLFWVGSAVGSFLNVVAWRMPRGRSINGLSRCPWCHHRLAARDNWPVFGWIALRGRCRTCRLPISPRYPIVELCVGLSIVAVGIPELYLGLSNLPLEEYATRAIGPLAMPHVTRPILAFWAFHTVAIASSWALGLVRFDGQRLPPRLIAWVLAFAIIPILAWWPLGVVTWQATPPEDWPQWSFLDSVMRVLTGLVAAVVVARSMARYLSPQADPKLDPTGDSTRRLLDLVAMLAVPGVIVGWQGLLNVVLIGVLLAALARGRLQPGGDGLSWLAVSLPVALSIHLVLWRFVETSGWIPSTQSPPWVVLIAAAAVLIVPAVLRRPKAVLRRPSIETKRDAGQPTDRVDPAKSITPTEPIADRDPAADPRSAESD